MINVNHQSNSNLQDGYYQVRILLCNLNPNTEKYCSRILSQEIPHILTSLGRDLDPGPLPYQGNALPG